MSLFRTLVITLVACLVAPAIASAAQCELQITISCDDVFNSSSNARCTSVTTNIGEAACSGKLYSGFAVLAPTAALTLSKVTTTASFLTDCQIYPPDAVDPAQYTICSGTGTLNPSSSYTSTADLHLLSSRPSPLTVAAGTGVSDPVTNRDLSVAEAQVEIVTPTCTTSVSAPANTLTGSTYSLTWTPVSSSTAFEIQESTDASFAGAITQSSSTTSKTFSHTATTATTYYYRVRAASCNGGPGPYSTTVAVVVSPGPAAGPGVIDLVAPIGSTNPIKFDLFIPGVAATGKTGVLEDPTFTATTDKSWLSVSPATGPLPPAGTTVQVTGNPAGLPVGATTGTVIVTTSGQPVLSAPVSISLVTPAAAGGLTVPPASALIIPGVAHVDGSARFQSDVRLTNANSLPTTYRLHYTPANSDGSVGKTTMVTVDPQQTVALNDVVKDFFGIGVGAEPGGLGFLEIRSIGSSSPLTYSASRTYANTVKGTYGQYIPAIPYSSFVAQSQGAKQYILSLQQVSDNARFRTNLGLVEASGQPATGHIKIYNDAGTLVRDNPFSLRGGEYTQMNAYLSNQGLTLDDARLEISVDSPTGVVTAYASVLDNKTQDPLLVQPVHLADATASRWVLPGMADLNNGAANFHSDIRIFNSGTTAVDATLTYYPQGAPGSPTSVVRNIRAGEVLALDNVLPSVFQKTSTGGSILITTPTATPLVASGRTYSNDAASGGTFGQFIPAVSPSGAIDITSRPLQILQLEQSSAFRTNIGLAEVSGSSAVVRVSLHLPDSKFIPSIDVPLAANEFKQLVTALSSLMPANTTFNGRVTVQVVSGTGRVAAYGSVIDNRTQDPTYVPAQ